MLEWAIVSVANLDPNYIESSGANVMIPLRLTVKNFLCYREDVPTLDLEGIHVACLSGQNGHGKSALLDAITWALWGKARGKNQDELIHYGTDEMRVDLEFQARDTSYRVIRRHAISRSSRRHGTTDLQLQVLNVEEFRAITGNTMRETQARIDQIIGMDYETFINSAFLLQGRADEFTNKAPGERKEVLAKVLGLGYYDLLQERAKEHFDERRVEASIVEGDLERMRREVSRKDGYYSGLELVTGRLAEINSRREASRSGLDGLRMGVEDLGRRRDQWEEVKARIPSIERELLIIKEDMDVCRSRIDDYRGLFREKEEIEGGLARLLELRRRYEEMDRSWESFDQLTQHRSELERAVDSARARLEEHVDQLRKTIEVELRPRADSAPKVTGQLEEARVHQRALATEEHNLSDNRRHLQELAVGVGQLEASTQRLKIEGQELRSKLNLVKKSGQGARCPLCDTELGAQGYQSLTESYIAQIEEKLGLYGENENAFKAADVEKQALEEELPKQEAALRYNQREAQSGIAALELQLEESQFASRQLEQVSLELAQEESHLRQGTYASLEREQLSELEVQIGSLGYDREAHRSLYGDMQGLQAFEERSRRVQEAVANLPQAEQSLERSTEMYQLRDGELQASREKQRVLEADLLGLPELEDRLKEAEKAHQVLENEHGELFRRQVELEGDLKKMESMEQDIGDRQTRFRELREEQGIYQELVQAFGRRGIQAMLIETVLPSIEEQANTLLARMTDNRMHLKLESQRQRRSGRGEPIETLEINISDEMGPRSYELFSGGEAFRINLALRIALSKVLANRKGAPLPTLFIDEGFGTQDAAGRERILDVIRAIQGDFQKIIVITHLDDLKEAFQTRIEVEKVESGSTFWIS